MQTHKCIYYSEMTPLFSVCNHRMDLESRPLLTLIPQIVTIVATTFRVVGSVLKMQSNPLENTVLEDETETGYYVTVVIDFNWAAHPRRFWKYCVVRCKNRLQKKLNKTLAKRTEITQLWCAPSLKAM